MLMHVYLVYPATSDQDKSVLYKNTRYTVYILHLSTFDRGLERGENQIREGRKLD